MATDLERLVVSMQMDIRQFEKQLARANNTTTRELTKMERKFQASNKKIAGSIASFGRGFAGGLIGGGIAVAGAELAKSLSEAVKQAANIGDLADRIGIASNELQNLQFGAIQANIGFDELTQGLDRFSKVSAEATHGQGELAAVLKANGVTLTGDINENLRQFADLVKNAANEQDRMLLILTAFGRGGAEWSEFLRNGREGLDKLRQAAIDAHFGITPEFIKMAQEIDDKWAALMLRMDTATKQWALGVIAQFRHVGQEGFAGMLAEARRKAKEEGVELFGVTVQQPQRVESLRAGGNTDVLRRAQEQQANAAKTTGKATVIPSPEDEKAAAAALRDSNRERERAIRLADRMVQQFDNAIRNQAERTDALLLETALVGKSTEVQETYRAKLELTNAAKEAGIELTPDVIASINAEAEAYGKAADKREMVQDKFDKVDEANRALRDSTQEFFSDLAHGVNAVDALTDALQRLADKMLDLALNTIFDTLFKTGAGSPAGGLLGSLFASVRHQGGIVGAGGAHRMVPASTFMNAPRMHGGGIAGGEVATILKKGELVLPQGFPMRRGGGGEVSVNIINNHPGAQIQQQQRQGPDGRRIIEAIITEKLPGMLNKIMPAQFGVTPKLRNN